MLTGRLHYDPAGGYPAKTFIKFSYMRSDRFLDLRRSQHALKLDFGRSFHFRLFSDDDCPHIKADDGMTMFKSAIPPKTDIGN
jgi:hypothetical protein